MDRCVYLCLLTLSLVVSMVALDQKETTYMYIQLGGKAVLEPNTADVSKPITRIVWQHRGRIIAEWNQKDNVTTYTTDSTCLNTLTGQLVINNFARTQHFGEYSVVFNNNFHRSQKYNIDVMSKVPMPSVPLLCSSSSPFCTLSCDGDVTNAGSVTYSWRKDGGDWEESTWLKDTNYCKWQKDKKVSCQMKNSIGVNGSEPCDKPSWQAPSDGEVSTVPCNREVQEETYMYIQLGGNLVLEPNTSDVSKPITIISWLHQTPCKPQGEIIAEWTQKDNMTLTPDCTFLNPLTGQLVINNFAKTDVGVYSVAFNIFNFRRFKKYNTDVMSKVPKPSVPLLCSSSSPFCTLSCDGDVTNAGSVTYSWRKDGGDWEESTWLKNITNDDKWQKVKNISCQMKNSIGVNGSEPCDKPSRETPSNEGVAPAAPSDGEEVSTVPSDGEVSTVPSDGEVSTVPSDGEVSTVPSKKAAAAPSSGGVAAAVNVPIVLVLNVFLALLLGLQC